MADEINETTPVVNMNSILISVKKDLNVALDDDYFDPDLIMHINSALSVLAQLGVGPKSGFYITDSSATWSDFLGDDPLVNLVKTYVSKKVKVAFDPPNTGPLSEALNKTISEMEWRIMVIVDPIMEGDDE